MFWMQKIIILFFCIFKVLQCKPPGGGGGLKAFSWYQTVARDFVVIEAQNGLARIEAF